MLMSEPLLALSTNFRMLSGPVAPNVTNRTMPRTPVSAGEGGEDLGKGSFGEGTHLLVASILDGMGSQHPTGMHSQGLPLGVGCLGETVRRHEHASHATFFEINEIVHTARRA